MNNCRFKIQNGDLWVAISESGLTKKRIAEGSFAASVLTHITYERGYVPATDWEVDAVARRLECKGDTTYQRRIVLKHSLCALLGIDRDSPWQELKK